ncbi:MAG: hypothetical protein CSA33_00165 [Desulfobulbus propionicus]|nr:MAG: hypothetical protein CSA33_00165 [Desulfobulbus propionicus]
MDGLSVSRLTLRQTVHQALGRGSLPQTPASRVGEALYFQKKTCRRAILYAIALEPVKKEKRGADTKHLHSVLGRLV